MRLNRGHWNWNLIIGVLVGVLVLLPFFGSKIRACRAAPTSVATARTVVSTRAAAATLTLYSKTPKPQVAVAKPGQSNALDMRHASSWSQFHQMLLVVLVALVLTFLADAWMGQRVERREFIATLLLATLVIGIRKIPWLVQLFTTIGLPLDNLWLLVYAFSMVRVFCSYGGWTPAGMFLTLLGVGAVLFGSTGEVGRVLGIKSSPLVSGSLAWRLIISGQASEAYVTLLILTFLLFGVLVNAIECGKTRAAAGIAAAAVYPMLKALVGSGPVLALLFSLVLALAAGVLIKMPELTAKRQGEKGEEIPARRMGLRMILSQSSPFDVVSVTLSLQALGFVVFGRI